jgi:YD repeat-containing protein
MRYRLFIFICFLLGSRSVLFSQTGTLNDPGANLSYSLPNIIPPSPEAHNFTRYGSLPVGLFTGTAQYAVPIYTITSGSLSHDISLNYATNGIKVDEIASRIGIGWTLRQGGTIVRTVQGFPDEFSDRSFYHGLVSDNNDFWLYVSQANHPTPPDYQPDEYSFNVDGMTGKFIKREDGSFKLYSASGIKIQQNSSTKKFTLVATNGTKYFFDYIEYTKTTSQTEPTVPANIPGFTATSWFLSKILTQSKDSIVFNYTSFPNDINYKVGISQEYSLDIPQENTFRLNRFSDQSNYLQNALGPACLDPECLYTYTSEQTTSSQGFYLSSIDFKGGKVDIVTSLRDDVDGERKIDTIKIKRSADDALIKCFAFTYNYSYNSATTYSSAASNSSLRKRLYLTEFKEVSRDLAAALKYQFIYDDYNALPPRLSFSQDHFGYFNGKVNSLFFPNDTWVDAWLGGNGFGGNRKYDFNYAKKGVLTKVIYPTGGYSTIEYEPHKVKNLVVYETHFDSSTKVSIDTSTIATQGIPVYSDTFSVSNRLLRLRIRCNWASTAPTFFPENYIADISVIDLSTGSCVGTCPISMWPGMFSGTDAINYDFNNVLAGYTGPFKLEVIPTQARLRVKAIVDKITYTIDTSNNVGIGGIRVHAVSDYGQSNEESNRREFLYYDWGNPSSTSGTGIFIDPDNSQFVSAVRRLATVTAAGPAFVPKTANAGNTILHSNSVRSLYLDENGTAVYSKVIELNHSSSNANNGGTEYTFYTDKATSASPLSSSELEQISDFSPYAADGYPLNNNDFKTGLSKYSADFTYTTEGGTRNILKETFHYYSLDSTRLSADTFYLVRQIQKRDLYTSGWHYFADYDVNKYLRYYSWVKLDSTVEKIYDGASSLKSRTNFQYSPKNYLVSEQSNLSSSGDLQTSKFRYPQDVTFSQPNYATFSGMSNANIISPVIEQNIFKNAETTPLLTKKNGFGNYTFSGYSIYLPDTIKSSLKGAVPESVMMFNQYDATGNLVQYKEKSGTVISMLYGYGNTYPVAKIVGATYSTASALLNSSILNAPSSDAALRTELDKLRTGLSGIVQVTTITYSPLIGVTSVTDPAGKTTYYEYDVFNRLSLVRDQKNYILKKICYNYYNQPTECSSTIVEPTPACEENCTGNDKKCINNICETALKICTASVKVGKNWVNTFHYKWSDNSVSADFQETSLFACVL